MTKTNDLEKMETQSRQMRKGTVWTKEKIAHLIQLYKQHDCLWNHYTEAYKNKDKRNKAIDNICGVLHISKFDFGKKIHNLRNQFNSEMKKLERRIEESGGNANDLGVSGQRCRWEHFESLGFLKNIIEPRPGYQSSFTQPKKMCLKYDYNSEEDAEHFIARIETSAANGNTLDADEVAEYFEEATAEDDDTIDTYDEIDQEMQTASKKDSSDNTSTNVKPSTHDLITLPVTTGLPKTYLARMHTPRLKQQSQTPQREEQVFNFTSTPITNVSTTNIKKSPSSINHMQQSGSQITQPIRDQWDVFGELVASEFRNLTTDVSRKKLKRKIMHAMLEVGDEDDSICVNVTVH